MTLKNKFKNNIKMNFPPFRTVPQLVNDKITLRPVLASDIPYLIEISFYDGKQAASLEEAIEMQEKIDVNYKEGDSVHWVIIDNRSGQITGTCGYYRGFEKATGELGCVLLPRFRGQGFMTLALQLAIDFGLKKMELKHIRAVTTAQNIAAIKLLQRLGFLKTADLQDHGIEFQLK